MPLPTRHVIPSNVARKYPPRKHGQEYSEFFYQLPGGTNQVTKKPARYSSIDGTSDSKTNFENLEQDRNNADLVGSREEASNRVLANMIRQIASLSLHAHGVFGRNWEYVLFKYMILNLPTK